MGPVTKFSYMTVLVAIGFVGWQMQWADSATEMKGRVMEIGHSPRMFGMGQKRVARIRAGRAYLEKSFGTKGHQYKPGDMVDVLVDPDDPTIAALEGDHEMNSIMAIVISLAFAAAATRQQM